MFHCIDAMSHCVNAMSHCVDAITKAIISHSFMQLQRLSCLTVLHVGTCCAAGSGIQRWCLQRAVHVAKAGL